MKKAINGPPWGLIDVSYWGVLALAHLSIHGCTALYMMVVSYLLFHGLKEPIKF